MHAFAGLIALTALWCGIVAGHAQDVTTGATLLCASAADAKEYATVHRDDVQPAIQSATDGTSCRTADVAFVAGKKTDRLRLQDATYVLTEIVIVAVKTPYGYLSTDSSPAFTWLKVEERAV
jgi:hypothetical protein